VDRELPIRPSSIRGQLRFWWRIACGSDESAETLFKREVAIWGGIAEAGPTASRVRVRVRGVGPLDLEPAHRYLPDPAAPGKFKSFPALAPWAEGYALFSAKGELTRDRRGIEDEPKVLAKPGTEFQLAIALAPSLTSEQRQEVLTTLRWWASFGGTGARTRRGLGAISVEGVDPVGVAEVTPRGGQLALRKPVSGATEAWHTAVGLLKDFRQRPGLGRNPGTMPQRPGRSLWPEADSIRALSGAADPRHSKRVVGVDGFPRAAFGLPIVFHFKDERTGDPGDHVLEPADPSHDNKRDRLASPLILRPYWNGGKWVPAALLLPGWEKHLGMALKFKGKGKGKGKGHYTPAPWPTDAARRKALAPGVRPLQGRGDNALSAFMQFFLEP
jgi:CRISPR-associated protein Cmr1